MEDIFIQSAKGIEKIVLNEHNSISPLILTLLSGGFGALFTLIITGIMTVVRDRKLNKLEHRTYIVAEEMDNLGVRLEGYNNIEGKDIRIIETDNFIEIDKLVKKKIIGGELLNYLCLKNIGTAMVLQCSITLKIESNTNVTEINKVVPIFSSNQEYFLLAQSLENLDHPQLLKSAIITYNTIANEKIKYIYDIRREQEKTFCRERYYVKTIWGYKLINSTDVEPVSWIYINHRRAKSNYI